MLNSRGKSINGVLRCSQSQNSTSKYEKWIFILSPSGTVVVGIKSLVSGEYLEDIHCLLKLARRKPPSPCLQGRCRCQYDIVIQSSFSGYTSDINDQKWVQRSSSGGIWSKWSQSGTCWSDSKKLSGAALVWEVSRGWLKPDWMRLLAAGWKRVVGGWG